MADAKLPLLNSLAPAQFTDPLYTDRGGGVYGRLSAADVLALAPSPRNLLINGAFSIWQRGTSIAVGAARTYTADRWVAYRSGFVLGATVSRQAGSQGQYCARVQRDAGNASTATISLVQQIATVNCIPYRGQYVTIAIRARKGADFSTAGGQLTARVSTGTGVDEAQDFAYAGLITNDTAIALTANMADYSSASFLVPANASEIAVCFLSTPTGVAGANDWYEVEEAQLVPAKVAGLGPGRFPYQSFEQVLAQCQCYYEKSYPQATAVPTNASIGVEIAPYNAGNIANGNTFAMINFKVTKRAVPTVTVYAYAGSATGRVTDGAGTDLAAGSGSTRNATDRQVQVFNNSGGAIAPSAGVFIFHWIADAEI
jgi:hypothetical protein